MLKPNAIRVMSRILVLTDSIRPLDRPCSIAARIESLVFHDAALQGDERGDAAAAGPADPPVRAPRRLRPGRAEDQPEAFLEQVGPVQPGVGLGDPGELGLLLVGEVLRVLPQRVAGHASALWRGRWRRSGPASGDRAAGGVPGLRGGPRRALRWPTSRRGTGRRSGPRSGSGSATTAAIQSAPSALTWVIWAHRSGPSRSKNAAQGGLVAARRGPHQPAACRGRPRPSGTCGHACRRSHRSRSGAARRTGRAAARRRPRPG